MNQENIQAKRECHRCPYNGKGDSYCWEVCLGPSENSNKGRSFVHLGAIEAQGEYLFANADDTVARKSVDSSVDDIELSEASEDGFFDDDDGEGSNPDRPENYSESRSNSVTRSLNEDVERALVVILANLMSLSDTRLCILRHVFHGEDMKKIGASLPVPMSKQAVFKHLLAMTRENRVVEKVVHQMMRDGHGGARQTVTQLDLFDAMGVPA